MEAQDALPGGRIGRPVHETDHTTWTRKAQPVHQPDTKLERTAARWDDGWYVVTSAPATRTATRREGPFKTAHDVEQALMRMAECNADELGYPEPSSATEERIAAIIAEGMTKRLYDACLHWTSRIGAAKETVALRGGFSPGTAQFEPLLLAGHENDPEIAGAAEAVRQAADRIRQWREE